MSTHIAIEGQVPQPVEYLRTLLPGVSFPPEAITNTAGYEDVITLAGYEPCTIVPLVGTLAWNQIEVLGAAYRSNGDLYADYTATNLASADAAVLLETAKTQALATMNSLDEAVFNTVETFSALSTNKTINLRPDAETIANLSRLMAVAQNAETGATVVDTNGNFVELTLQELLEINAAVVERASTITNNRAVTVATVKNATSTGDIDAAISNHQTNYGPYGNNV